MRKRENAAPDDIIARSFKRTASFYSPRHVRIVDIADSIGLIGGAEARNYPPWSPSPIDFGLAQKGIWRIYCFHYRGD